VNSKTKRLDGAFIERQRKLLTRLRDELAAASQGNEAEEKDINSQSSGQAAEYEDEAQRLAALELDGNLVARTMRRLAQVHRALEKIEEGTYGISDGNSQAIPRERLEEIPEAIYTKTEQHAREAAGLRGSGGM
jgi:DnaK suppressor protein